MSATYLETKEGSIMKTNTPEVWPEYKQLGTADGKRRLKEQAKERLLELIGPSPKESQEMIYTVLRHVSASGMTRRIDLYHIKNNQPYFLSSLAGDAMGYTLHKDGGLVVGGCGMDMGYHLVDSLSWALYGEGYRLKHSWL